MFKPEQVLADLNCVELLQVKDFVVCFRGYFRSTIVREDSFLEFIAVDLSEVDHTADLHLVLDTAN